MIDYVGEHGFSGLILIDDAGAEKSKPDASSRACIHVRQIEILCNGFSPGADVPQVDEANAGDRCCGCVLLDPVDPRVLLLGFSAHESVDLKPGVNKCIAVSRGEIHLERLHAG